MKPAGAPLSGERHWFLLYFLPIPWFWFSFFVLFFSSVSGWFAPHADKACFDSFSRSHTPFLSHLFRHRFNKYLVSGFYVTGRSPGAGDPAGNKSSQIHTLRNYCGPGVLAGRRAVKEESQHHSLVYNPNHGVFLRSPAPAHLCLVSRCHLFDANLSPISVYLRIPQAVPEGFQAASLPLGLSASKWLAPSPALCCDASRGACGLFQAGSVSCPVPSGSDKSQFSITCDNNECAACSLFQIINEDVKWDQNGTAPPWHPTRRLPTTWHSVICCFIILCLPWERRPLLLKEAESLIFRLLPRSHFRVRILKDSAWILWSLKEVWIMTRPLTVNTQLLTLLPDAFVLLFESREGWMFAVCKDVARVSLTTNWRVSPLPAKALLDRLHPWAEFLAPPCIHALTMEPCGALPLYLWPNHVTCFDRRDFSRHNACICLKKKITCMSLLTFLYPPHC